MIANPPEGEQKACTFFTEGDSECKRLNSSSSALLDEHDFKSRDSESTRVPLTAGVNSKEDPLKGRSQHLS